MYTFSSQSLRAVSSSVNRLSTIRRHIGGHSGVTCIKMASKQTLPLVTIASEVSGIAEHITKFDASIPVQVIDVADKPDITEENMRLLMEAEILITDPDLLGLIYSHLTKTKWVQSTCAGQDSFLKAIDPSKPFPKFKLIKFGNALAAPIAEYVVGKIIANERQFNDRHDAQKDKKWRVGGSYRLLSELSIGIIGAGAIGTEIARVCKAFGMTVWGLVRRNLPVEQRSTNIDHYCLTTNLPVVLANCDVICNVLPSTPQTIGFLSGDVLSHAKEKSPIFINVGRGDVMTEDCIINAIRQGWISQAILDVFPTEPLPPESPLWHMKEVTISPHESGLSFPTDVASTFIENYQRFVNGEDLKYTVDLKAGY